MKNAKIIVLIIIVLMFGISVSAETARSGKNVYKSGCDQCHDDGYEGAPRTGVARDWKGHSKSGVHHMLKQVKKGTGYMPAKGGCDDCTDAELKSAIEYIFKNTK